MPPQVNARLTRIDTADAADGVDDWDVEEAPPAGGAGVKWAGVIDAYYREKVDRVTTGDAVDVLTRRTAWVDTASLPDVVDTDDVVTLELDDGRTVVSPARTIARSALDGIPADIATTRLDLEDG